MAQLEITWPGYLYYDYARQAGQFVIEEYSYLEPFDPLKFTPFSPTYSLYWFTSLVRLLTEPFGLPFSTLLLGWLMGLISLVCMLKILWDLYPVLGKWTLAAALGLCALLFSETYLVWFNSLYGEGCILVGLVLTLMCAVHLCLMPTGKNWRKGVWLIGLALSLNILLTAKSQMLMAMPGAVLLFLLVIGGIWTIGKGIAVLTDTWYEVYDVDPDLIYRFYPALKTLNWILGVVTVALGVFKFTVRKRLKNFMESGPRSLMALYGVSIGISVLYLLAASVVMGVPLSVNQADWVNIAASVCMMFAQKKYYDRRSELFVN